MQDPTEFPPLSLEALQPLISTTWLGRPVFLFDQVNSTNTHAIKIAEKGNSHGTVVLAECQTAGKGRLGRTWHSPANMNAYFSVILDLKPAEPFISCIPLATGIALAEAIEEIAKFNVSLKWPNDLVVGNKKLGGILCERTTKGPKGGKIIVGVGININCRDKDFPSDLKEISTSLTIEAGCLFDRHALFSTILSKLEWYFDRVMNSELSLVRSTYVSRCSTLGRHIQIRLPGNKLIEGVATEIGPEGDLRIMPSNPSIDSLNKPPTPVSIRAGDVIHLR